MCSEATAEQILARYARGERHFNHLDFGDGVDLSNATLQDAEFSNCFFFDADFTHANLQNAKFLDCNLKCANFMHADLRGVAFSGSSIESIVLTQANTENATFKNTHAYGGIWNKNEPPH